MLKHPPPSQGPGFHHQIGEIHSKQGRTQEADAAYDAEIALLRETVGHDRDDVNARIDLGKALMARGHRDEAIAEFQAGMTLKPKDADFPQRTGMVLGHFRSDPPA